MAGGIVIRHPLEVGSKLVSTIAALTAAGCLYGRVPFPAARGANVTQREGF
jgi:hypothetical protein